MKTKYKRLNVKLFMGIAYWRSSGGELFSVDCMNDEGEILLQTFGTNLIWEDNLFIAAAESILYGNEFNTPFPYLYHNGDNLKVPWNRWKPHTAAEEAARINE